MRRKNEKTKQKLKMGTGTGANYKPYIQVGEFGSVGTATKVIDWKTGRIVHLMSQAEASIYYLLRWDDNNLDIREQYPLNLEKTKILADEFGISHPSNDGKPVVMTTDLLITQKDKSIAISIKKSLKMIEESDRTIQKLFLEKQYWKLHNTDFQIMTEDDINDVEIRNIRNVVEHYNDKEFVDEISFAKFLIAHKLIVVDMSKEIDYQKIIKTEEFKKWTKLTLELATKSQCITKPTES